MIENFALDGYDEISELQADVSEKALRYDNVFVKERVESKKNKKLQKKKRKAGLFGGGFSLKQGFSFLFGDSQNKIEYIDFVRLNFIELNKNRTQTRKRKSMTSQSISKEDLSSKQPLRTRF